MSGGGFGEVVTPVRRERHAVDVNVNVKQSVQDLDCACPLDEYLESILYATHLPKPREWSEPEIEQMRKCPKHAHVLPKAKV
jgi:hypothetical protein